MKKNRFYFFVMVALMLSFTLVLAGCGANPKDLAKQSYDLSQQAIQAFSDPAKAADIAKKAAEVEKKVEKLSQSDALIYSQELARLMTSGGK